jgi:hypothetical protein
MYEWSVAWKMASERRRGEVGGTGRWVRCMRVKYESGWMGHDDGDGLTGEVILDVNLDGLLIDLLTGWLKDEIELAKVREVAEEPA